MAARDTFEWFVGAVTGRSDPKLQQYIREQREYLLTLRSEDERQRFVDSVLDELRKRTPPRRP